jgi:hypothetical protein
MSKMNMNGNGGKLAFRKTAICGILIGKKIITVIFNG